MIIEKIIQRIGFKTGRPDPVDPDVEGVQKIIDYSFHDSRLLIQALTHRSYLTAPNETHLQSNERLEFLGDAVLDLIITDQLYHSYPQDSEGVLSKKKSVLVSRHLLAEITDSLGLGDFLLVNKGEEKTGGRKRQSNLANLFEAILGAIYLDGGMDEAVRFVNRFLYNQREELLSQSIYFNYKSELLEYAQGKGWGIPVYSVIDEKGPDHEKFFTVRVTVNDKEQGTGTGSNKKNAEQLAAKDALKKIRDRQQKQQMESTH